ncbi:MAG: hypothetical protein B6226_01735 [Candidatus Cloacimonetes bacterium 4572_65]|nr:MAG: hypothetical protein B6226_01735 [Candidatus Cloacimonetes bacterium 4572_65]
MQNKNEHEPIVTIFDAFIALAKRKWFIIIFTAIFSISAVIYVLVTPEIWRSSTTFISVSDDMSAKGIGASMLGNVGLDFLGGVSGAALNSIMYLDSRDLTKKAVEKFNMIEYFEIAVDDDPIKAREIALKNFRAEVLNTFYDKETDSITIRAFTKSQELSKEIVEYYLAELEKYNTQSKTTKGKLKRIFLEKRVEEINSDFNSLTTQLTTIQKDSKLIAVESQVKQMYIVYSDIVSQKEQNELLLAMNKKLYGVNNPTFKELTFKQEELTKTLKKMESEGSISDFFIPLKDIPDASMQLYILEMKLQINRKMYEFLYPQFEMARIEEIKELPTIEVISQADIEGLRVKPKRALVCVLVFLVSFMVSSVMALTFEFTSSSNKEKFNTAIKIFFGRK